MLANNVCFIKRAVSKYHFMLQEAAQTSVAYRRGMAGSGRTLGSLGNVDNYISIDRVLLSGRYLYVFIGSYLLSSTHSLQRKKA